MSCRVVVDRHSILPFHNAYMHSICVSFGSSLYSCHRLFARLLLQEEFRGLLAHLELKREEILVHGGTRREALAREEI